MQKFRIILLILIITAVCLPAQALEPGSFPIVIYANEDYRLNLTFKSYTTPVNLTGYSFKLQAKKAYGLPAFLTFSSSVTNAAAGQTSFWLTRQATAANSRASGVYDLMQTDPSGNVSYKLRGTIEIRETATR